MKLKALLVLCLVSIAAACATTPPPPPKAYCTDGREVPLWTIQGAMAFPADLGKILYGTGVSSNITNPALLRESADNRAINDLAKQFEVYSSSLMEDYMAATSQDGKASEEQNVETIKKTVVKQTLNGVMIADRCQDRASGVFYSLARLDVAKFVGALERNTAASNAMKEYVRANAEKMAEKLAREEEQR